MSVQLVPLGEFQPDDIATGKIVALEPTGALVDFDINQLVHVSLFDLSFSKIRSLDEALRVGEVREFLVVGNYDGQRDIFFSHCSPETLIGSDRLLETAQELISLRCGYPVAQENIILHTQIIEVRTDGKSPGVLVRLKWFLRSEDHPPTIFFSIRQLEIKIALERARQLQAEKAIVYATILEKVRYGGLVKVEGLRGYIQTYVDKHRDELVEGTELPLQILKVREDHERLILLHHPVWLRLKQLQVGQIVNGLIKAVKYYGIIVDLGDVRALLPTSSIPNSSAEQLSQTFEVGAPLEVRLAEVNIERHRFTLESIDN